MKQVLLITLVTFLFAISLNAQQFSPTYTTPPTDPNVRTMAEWEEIDALVVTWTGSAKGFPNIVRQIIKHAQEEVKVIVICADSNQVISNLNTHNIPIYNVSFVEDFFNSVWIRDYGATTIYGNTVDSLYLVDWIYNRPRPLDDRIPKVISDYNNLSLYSTTLTPYDLVNTGGNFMSDGQGTAFASKLILDENGPTGTYNSTPKTEQQIDSIMLEFMGINNFIKTDMVPYNRINHIDMYMKLLNEETLLIGEYPSNVADGPVIEQNVNYIKNNAVSTFGTPYRIIRVQMPPDSCGHYPDYNGASCFTGTVGNYTGHYRTYTNLVFVNKMVLVPIYSYQYDTSALKIIQRELPGYKVVGIDCDEMIGFDGALHCITKAIGSRNPLLMVHQQLRDTIFQANGYDIQIKLQHRSGIQSARLYYTTDTAQGFQSLPLSQLNYDYWIGNIPSQPKGSTVYYYIKAKSYSGKEQVRPITAPQGFWEFYIKIPTNVAAPEPEFHLKNVFPNPTGDKLFIPIDIETHVKVDVCIYNLNGQIIKTIYSGELPLGQTVLETSLKDLSSGTYFVVLQSPLGRQSQKIVKK